MKAGLLLTIPALISQHLFKAEKHYSTNFPSGYYGLKHILIVLALMALSRIKNPEQLKNCAPGELGKIIGLDRIPEVRCLRKKIACISEQKQARIFQDDIAQEWITHDECIYFNIDGHVSVYNGSKATLPKKYVSRQKLCLSGTTEFWVNDSKGMPVMNVKGELTENLTQAIEQIIPTLIKDTKPLREKNQTLFKETDLLFTLIFDREAYQPSFFKKLLDQKIAVITYRKNVKDKWDEKLFESVEIQVINKKVRVLLCEQKVELDGITFREIRELMEDGHQTAMITTNLYITKEEVAGRLFSRWSQENYFNYMLQDYSLDHIIEYGIEVVDQNKKIVNPAYSRLSHLIKKEKEKKQRLDSKMYKIINEQFDKPIDHLKEIIFNDNNNLRNKIQTMQNEINQLEQERKKLDSKIEVKDMPEQTRYNQLKTESKLFINTIKMIAFRAETAMLNQITPFYKNIDKDGRMLIKQILNCDADIKPDYKNKILNVYLHSMSTPRANQAAIKLCEVLNETETVYPDTELVIKYKSLAS